MFRLQNNVPEVFPDKSRDFQMFCRLYDVAFNSVKQSIDSLQNATSTSLCDASLLRLLKDKLGFFTSVETDDTELRYILQAFPTIMRYKGSQKAIDYITNLYSRLISSISTASDVTVTTVNSTYTIEVSSEKPVVKSDLLFELLKYVLPTGYIVDYYVTEVENSASQFNICNELFYNVTDDPAQYKVAPARKTVIVIKSDVVPTEQISKPYNLAKELPNIVNVASVADIKKQSDA